MESKKQMKRQNKMKTDLQIQRTNEWLSDGSKVGGGVKQGKGIKRYNLQL